jgi:hypothetical protein
MQTYKHSALGLFLWIIAFGCIRDEKQLEQSYPDPIKLSSTEALHLQPAPASETNYVVGQTIYAPVYSEIYYQDEKVKILLSATLSIHNTSLDSNIVLAKVNYYDSKGTLLRQYLKEPVLMTPLGNTDFVVEHSEKQGGTGANFIVEWRSAHRVSEPLVETIMISGSSSRGVSFVSRGKVCNEFSVPKK